MLVSVNSERTTTQPSPKQLVAAAAGYAPARLSAGERELIRIREQRAAERARRGAK